MKTRDVHMVSFGTVADFRNGVNFPSDCRGGADATLAVIGVGDFQSNERISAFDELEHIVPPMGFGKDALLQDGDLVFVRSNGSKALVGRCMRVEGVDRCVTHSGFTIRARVKPGILSSEWVLQFFATGLAAQAIGRLGRGTNISNLSQDVLRRLEIPAPSRSYESRVLAVSDRLFHLDEQFRDLTLKHSELGRGLAQQLLTGKKRFSEFCKSAARQRGEFGMLPADWHVESIADIASERSVRGAGDDVVVYSCTKHDGLVPSLEYFGKQVFSRDLSVYKRLEGGDFAYATNHIEEGSIGLLHAGMASGVVSPMYTVFRCGEAINPEFLYAVLKTENYRRVFARRTSASVNRRGSLRWKEFSKIRVPVPSRAEQDRIVAVLELAKAELALLEQQRDLYTRYKRGLMAGLLSGEIKVPA